ncbi:hypothetical protein SAY87_024826 [Trapa incisa]|uniref:Uncharacterized protein n=1 Tax=Trapa incisa TaxID=236973 RepID=A0AAN7GCN2_9MYRT|nr:hypothetical protein SAY87_024826 [Trapa incisa]
MGRFAFILAVVFIGSVAFSRAESELPEKQTGTDALSFAVPELIEAIVLPESVDSAESAPLKNEIRTVESNEAVTTVTFRPADHMVDGRPMMPISFRFPFRHGRPCHHHGRRPVNPSDLPAISREMPYGNDMILANEKPDPDRKGSEDPAPWTMFHRRHHHHHHGRPELEEKDQMFQMKWPGDEGHDGFGHKMKRFHHDHRLFKRDEDEEEKHHHHHHHHHDEEGSGFMTKIRKFLADMF